MTVPDFQSLMLPLLKLAGDGHEHTLSEADDNHLTVLPGRASLCGPHREEDSAHYLIAYVERQQQHHAEHTAIGVLERTEDQEGRLLRASSSLYLLDDAAWRRELEALDDL
jgi:hypothetical protein